MFFLTEFTDVCNFADGTFFFACDSDLKNIMERLKHDTELATKWFENNYMKLNEGTCHLLVAGHRCETLYGLTLEKLGFGNIRMKNCLN